MKDVSYWLKNDAGKILWTCVQYDEDKEEHIGLTLDMLLNFEESVKTVINNMDDEAILYMLGLPKEDLITLHHGFGTSVRNGLGLWVPYNPHVGAEHPDDYSFKIVEEIWQRLQNTPFDARVSQNGTRELSIDD